MNSITFVVDKLTPPSTPLHPHPPHHSNPSSSVSHPCPDSGYFSLYSSEIDDKDIVTRAHPILRRRTVGIDENEKDEFRERSDEKIPQTNIAIRCLQYAFSAITGMLWALLYPFSRSYYALQRIISHKQAHPILEKTAAPPHPLPPEELPLPAIPTHSDHSHFPANTQFRPFSSTSSASEVSSSSTDSDAETDISTIAATDISETSSFTSAASSPPRRSPRLHSVAEKEELLALTRRRTADSLKSPTSPRTPSITSTTATSPLPVTTPKTAAQLIPRPLIPVKPSQKTLVLDLDETLIHSLAKGGKLGSGHMVEVKFDKHAILYFVHKRPFCDLFLRKVSKWYDCVIFTASVQEYADPVIDWLEAERKIFKARYYRQHCTIENGAYIKDLSVVEGDLGKVCILDNSPISYAWHEANAIPVEGWISDPTDNDLLHLIPFLRALRFVGDVRNLLGLRNGGRKT